MLMKPTFIVSVIRTWQSYSKGGKRVIILTAALYGIYALLRYFLDIPEAYGVAMDVFSIPLLFVLLIFPFDVLADYEASITYKRLP